MQEDPQGTMMCQLPALQRSSFSFPMGSVGLGEASSRHTVAAALQICCLCCSLSIYTSSRQGSVQLAWAFGKHFPDACKMPFFFLKLPSSMSLSGRADPWHPKPPYGAITSLPAWLFLRFSCIMGVSRTRAFLFPLLQLSTLPGTANLEKACQLFCYKST